MSDFAALEAEHRELRRVFDRSSADLERACSRLWDCIILGAGPAGASAAIELARSNLSVLVLEKDRFPRNKVCGGLLNAESVKRLEELGLAEALRAAGAVPARTLVLQSEDRRCSFHMSGGLCISRRTLDEIVVRAARDAGALVLEGSRASIGAAVETSHRAVWCNGRELRARMVIAATGLVGAPLAAGIASIPPASARQRLASSRVGVGGLVAQSDLRIPPGEIHMLLSPVGYVGAASVEGEVVDVAAALDVEPLREQGAAELMMRMLRGFDAPVDETSLNVQWRGTAALTQRASAPGGTRLILCGDAAGYVEPFTGEGIAWALRGGALAARHVQQCGRRWSPRSRFAWDRVYRREVRRDQLLCSCVARALRHPGHFFSLANAVSGWPWAQKMVLRRLQHASPP